MMQREWQALVALDGAEAPVLTATADGELPCPACGTAAPLVEGACSDCGLVLE